MHTARLAIDAGARNLKRSDRRSGGTCGDPGLPQSCLGELGRPPHAYWQWPRSCWSSELGAGRVSLQAPSLADGLLDANLLAGSMQRGRIVHPSLDPRCATPCNLVRFSVCRAGIQRRSDHSPVLLVVGQSPGNNFRFPRGAVSYVGSRLRPADEQSLHGRIHWPVRNRRRSSHLFRRDHCAARRQSQIRIAQKPTQVILSDSSSYPQRNSGRGVCHSSRPHAG